MTTHTPLRCSNSGMASYSGKVLLLNTGNYPSYNSYLNQSWIYNGANGAGDWTNASSSSALLDPAGPLPGRTDHILAYDGTNVMLYGGRGISSTDGVFQDTWLFNTSSSTWSKASPSVVPYGRAKAECAYLSGAGVVMFGGVLTNGQMLSESWLWNGSTWAQTVIVNGTGPGARVDHCMAASSNTVVMFGGSGNNSQNNHTWKYTTAGGGWTQLFPTVSPSIRSGACMSWDSTNSVFVLFGGRNEYNYLPETFTYSLSTNTWTQVSIGSGPCGKVGAQMSFDTTSNLNVMFGGIDATTNYPSNETWTFNGATNVWKKL